MFLKKKHATVPIFAANVRYKYTYEEVMDAV